MKVLVIGGGGREHALAWKIKASSLVETLVMAPGNPGMAALGELRSVSPTDVPGLMALARDMAADLVVIGPEVVDGKARPLYIYAERNEKSGSVSA